MDLLERHSLLQGLEELLEESTRGEGGLVCLLGEAGVGKSTLASTLATSAAGRMRVVWGACEDLSTPEPLAPLHDLARSGEWSTFSAEDTRTPLSLFNAVLSALLTEPTLVVLEDLHWADDATLDFVRFLGRRVRDTHILVVVTARNDASEAQTRLRRALVDVPPDICTRVELLSLSQAAVRDLARRFGQDGDKVFALTDGNPFLVTEILRSGLECPPTVRDALLLRSERLSPGAQNVLQTASIFPRRVEADVLQRICPSADADHLAQCVAAGILLVEDHYYCFRHEIARRAMEEWIAPNVRTELNRLALNELRNRSGVATARLVHHAIAAGDVEAVCDLAPQAAEEAARLGAHRQASQHYAAALAHSAGLPAEGRAELYERNAIELQLFGRILEAIESFKQALTLRQRCDDGLAAGDILRWLGRLHYLNGERQHALTYSTKAIEALEPLGPGPELAMAYASRAYILALVNDPRATEWAERTIELATKLDRSDILTDAHIAIAIATHWNDIDTARANYARALELALQLGGGEMVARIFTNRAWMELHARHNANAHRLFKEGLAYCQDRDLDTWAAYMKGWYAELMVREGQWEDARTLAEQTLAVPSLTRLIRFANAVPLARLYLRTGAGEVSELLDHLAFDTEPQRFLIYAPILGECAWVQDINHGEALAVLERAAIVADQVGNTWAAGEIAYWRTKLGQTPPKPLHIAHPYRLQLEGDWAGAAAAWASLAAPYEEALALLEGDDNARRQGLLALEKLGARAVAERVRAEFRRRGLRGIARGPRASTRANAVGLTTRQLEILGLVDAGLTNAQIAAKLCLSIKTVNHHVSAILAKLSATTRVEASARAKEAGLL
jgi:DNA-binding CsgD family transcriptional regulator